MALHYNPEIRLSQPLNGAWQFRQASQTSWLPATVPGCNFTDLEANGVIDDPFYRDNESRVQWVEREDWIYRRTFSLNPELAEYDDIQLVADGLDTYCDILLNGTRIGTGENMFIGQRISCKPWLVEGENTLEIYFHSPITQTRPRFEQAGFAYPAENDKSEDKLSVYNRKAPCHFGWDWGPRFVTSGIFRDIYLQGVHNIRIQDVAVRQCALSDERARLRLDIAIAGKVGESVAVSVECAQTDVQIPAETVTLTSEEQTHALFLDIPNPRRWWPNGLGEAFLYHFSVSLSQQGHTLDTCSQSAGLRTVEVVSEPDSFGQAFYLKVNGHDVFMKGANYIPADSFVHRVTPARQEALIHSAASANMNMLRVWGGGLYQDDHFYDLADQYGMLIWQDFMFACSLYPGDDAFLTNVMNEADAVIRRLRNHPCIALWCGNNEVDMAIKHWQWPEKFDYSEALYQRLKADYMTLFDDILPGKVEEHDSGRFYLRSSPIGFWEDDEDHIGNHHYWGVWHGEEPFSEYQRRVPRFMSEYGFQSFPMPASFDRFTLPQDQHLDSEVLAVHQKHPRGNRLISQYMQGTYPQPQSFADLVYLSQVQQALGLKLAFDAHREARPFCMGTLYWQLNDTWPAASWAGIDYYGKWKALHYQARRSFAPLHLILSQDEETVSVTVTNDTLRSCVLTCTYRLCTLSGDTLHGDEAVLTLEPNALQCWQHIDCSEALRTVDKTELALVAQMFDSEGELVDETVHYFASPVEQPLAPHQLDMQTDIVDNELIVTLHSTVWLRQVYLEVNAENLNFDDNFFDLRPAQTKVVRLALTEAECRNPAPVIASLRSTSVNACQLEP
ncbi:beta-mannosidase [Alteromonas halophila]|uniref:Beta-mannosidase B n=1 Tax=Alteromonas halophila TaxID=516698 RepID=A0A918JLC6_9ALTE|nr:glycoside hydrolase family 2 protein [Alteromonas halophila]GGW84779.1 beta-mannosidase [Alteromonas halophila]